VEFPEPLRKLRVFHSDAGLQFGGQEFRTLEEVRRTNELGATSWAIVRRGGRMECEARRRKIPYYAISMSSSADIVGFAQLLRLVRRLRPHVICAHSSHDFYLAWPFRAIGIPVLRYRHISEPVKPTWARNFVYRTAASKVVATAECIKAQLVAHNGVRPDRIVVIGEGVDLTKFSNPRLAAETRASLGFPEDAVVIGTVGMVRSGKGYDVLVDAAARVIGVEARARFLLIGGPTADGAYFREIHALISRLGIREHVIMTGWRDDVPDLMAALDVFVLASTGTEGQSRVIPEAFALGRPVVASQFGGIPELVRDGENGLLVPPRDPSALADALLRMVRDPALRLRCGQAGRHFAHAHLDFDLRLRQSLALYQSLVAKG
jgi:glycosyltransferase involved in cell wall biosynthesis